MTSQPYPGLRPFRRDETEIFFGRERYVDQMVDRLREHRFLAVTGTSGSGKSSIVKTGLLSALELGLLDAAGGSWSFIDMRPGTRPMDILADNLLEVLEFSATRTDAPVMRAALERGPKSLAEYISRFSPQFKNSLLILVDQFEEIFRFSEGEAQSEAEAFVDLLLGSANQREVPIYIVLTMRSDYLGDCAHFYGLPEMINRGQFLTPRMTRAEYRKAIEEPARVCGGFVEPAVTSRVLNDMVDVQDQLCLVQHAMMMMWRRAAARTPSAPRLTLDDYKAIGGLIGFEGEQGALSKHADEVYEKALPSDRHRDVAKRMFQRLTEGAGRGSDVRNPTSFRDLVAVTGAKPGMLREVIETFRAPENSLLMPPVPSAIGDSTIIDISHESLIRQWKRLKAWTTDEFESSAMYRRLEDAARRWQEGKAGFWTEPDLGQAVSWRDRERPNAAWAKRYGENFPTTIEFLETSRTSAAKARRRSRIMRVASLVVPLVMLLISGYAFVSAKKKTEMENWKNSALQGQFAHLVDEASKKLTAGNAEDARAIGLAAQRIVSEWNGGTPLDTPEYRNVLFGALERDAGSLYLGNGPVSLPVAARFTPDGKRIVWSQNGGGQPLVVSNADTGQTVSSLVRKGGDIRTLVVSPDGRYAAVLDEYDHAELIRLDGNTPKGFEGVYEDKDIKAIAFGEVSAGPTLVTLEDNGEVVTWRIDGEGEMPVASIGMLPKIPAEKKEKSEETDKQTSEKKDPPGYALSCFKSLCAAIDPQGALHAFEIGESIVPVAHLKFEGWQDKAKPSALQVFKDQIIIVSNHMLHPLQIVDREGVKQIVQFGKPEELSAINAVFIDGESAISFELKTKQSSSILSGTFEKKSGEPEGWSFNRLGRLNFSHENIKSFSTAAEAAVVLEVHGDDSFLKLIRADTVAGEKCDGDCGDYRWLGGDGATMFSVKDGNLYRLDADKKEQSLVKEGFLDAAKDALTGTKKDARPEAGSQDIDKSAPTVLGSVLDTTQKRMFVLLHVPLTENRGGTQATPARPDRSESETPRPGPQSGETQGTTPLHVFSIDLATGEPVGQPIAVEDQKPNAKTEFAGAGRRDLPRALTMAADTIVRQGHEGVEAAVLEGELDDNKIRVVVLASHGENEIRLLSAMRDDAPQDHQKVRFARNDSILWLEGSQVWIAKTISTPPAGAASLQAPGRDIISLPGKGSVVELGFLEAGLEAFVAFEDGTIKVWSLVEASPRVVATIHASVEISTALWSDDELIVHVQSEGKISSFDRTGSLLNVVRSDRLSDVRALAGGRLFVIDSGKYQIVPKPQLVPAGAIKNLAEATTVHWMSQTDDDVEKNLVLGNRGPEETPTVDNSGGRVADACRTGATENSSTTAQKSVDEAYEQSCSVLHNDSGMIRSRKALAISELTTDQIKKHWPVEGTARVASLLAGAGERDPVSIALLARDVAEGGSRPLAATAECSSDRITAARAMFADALQKGEILAPYFVALELACEGAGGDSSLGNLRAEIERLAERGDALAQILLGICYERNAATDEDRRLALFHYGLGSRLLFAERERRAIQSGGADQPEFVDKIERSAGIRRANLTQRLGPEMVAAVWAEIDDRIARQQKALPVKTASDTAAKSWGPHYLQPALADLARPDLEARLDKGEQVLAEYTGGKQLPEVAAIMTRASYGLLKHREKQTLASAGPTAPGPHGDLLVRILRTASAAQPKGELAYGAAVAELLAALKQRDQQNGSVIDAAVKLADYYASRIGDESNDLGPADRGDLYMQLTGKAEEIDDRDLAARFSLGAVCAYEDLSLSSDGLEKLDRAQSKAVALIPDAASALRFDVEANCLGWRFADRAREFLRDARNVPRPLAVRVVTSGIALQELFLRQKVPSQFDLSRMSSAYDTAARIAQMGDDYEQVEMFNKKYVLVEQERLQMNLSPFALRTTWANIAYAQDALAFANFTLDRVDAAKQFEEQAIKSWGKAKELQHPKAVEELIDSRRQYYGRFVLEKDPVTSALGILESYHVLSESDRSTLGNDEIKASGFLGSILGRLAKLEGVLEPDIVADACDRLAGHPNDPFSPVAGLQFEKILNKQDAVSACKEIQTSSVVQSRTVFQLARAMARRDGRAGEASLEKYQRASAMGYPMAFNNIGSYYLQDVVDKTKAAENYLQFFNRISHCCARHAVSYLLSHIGTHDLAEVKKAAVTYISWAGEVGSAGALEAYARWMLAGDLDPPPGTDAAREAYRLLRLAARQYKTGDSDRFYEWKEDEAGAVRTAASAEEIKSRLDTAVVAQIDASIGTWKFKDFSEAPPWMVPPSSEAKSQ